MWIVEISYGMEHYQTQRKEFETEEEANTFFSKEVLKGVLRAELYEKRIIAKYSALNK